MKITSTTINETYLSCCIRRHENRSGAIAVPPFLSTAHAFSRRRLEDRASFVICALKKLSKTLRRSNGCEGLPWIVARHFVAQDLDYQLDVVDRLLAMAVALDMVTAFIPENAPSDMLYIIIEDVRIIRQCKINKSIKGAIWD